MRLYLLERAFTAGALFLDLEEVEAEAGLDGSDDDPGLGRESRLLELGNHLAAAEKADLAAARRARRIFGGGARESREILARLEPLGDRVELGPRLLGGPLVVDLEQDVARPHLLGLGEFAAVAVVVGAQALVGDTVTPWARRARSTST